MIVRVNDDVVEIDINNTKIDLRVNDARELRDKLSLKIKEYDSKEKQEFNHQEINKPEIITGEEDNNFELFKKETKPELYY